MAMFDVFVEGPNGSSQDALQRLAAAMSERYGLVATDIIARLANGRVRVKGNLDATTANTYARDLEAIGARVTIVSCETSPTVSPNVVQRGGALLPPGKPRPAPASILPPRTTPQPAPASLLPPGKSQPPPTSPLPPRTSAPPATAPVLPPANAARANAVTPPFASGLAAAFSENTAAPGLGALEGDELSLGSLDDDEPKAKISFTPTLPASMGPAAGPLGSTKPARAERPKDVPLDLFAPPDAGEAELRVDLAVDDEAAPKRAPTPPPVAAPATPASPVTPVLQRKSAPSIAAASSAQLGGVVVPEPRWRFAAGVLVAIVLGFVPAHLIAASRESSTFATIDEHVMTVQSEITRPDTAVPYAKLDDFRDDQEARKVSERRKIALLALLIWAAAAGAVAYVWFRRVPWDRLKLP